MQISRNAQVFILQGAVLSGILWRRVDMHRLKVSLDRLSLELTAHIDQTNDELSGRMDRISDDTKPF